MTQDDIALVLTHADTTAVAMTYRISPPARSRAPELTFANNGASCFLRRGARWCANARARHTGNSEVPPWPIR